jgi:hypothetical protein
MTPENLHACPENASENFTMSGTAIFESCQLELWRFGPGEAILSAIVAGERTNANFAVRRIDTSPNTVARRFIAIWP